jgi:MarR family transcriptional regulator, organic hydroperoxide resistance regulator
MTNNIEISKELLEATRRFHCMAKTVINEYNKTMNPFLTDKQFHALIYIQNSGKTELKNLSKLMNVSTSSLCILLNKLVDNGYVYREEDKKDRRNTFYDITDDGFKILQIEKTNRFKILNDKLDKLSEDKKAKFYETLLNLKEMMDEIL